MIERKYGKMKTTYGDLERMLDDIRESGSYTWDVRDANTLPELKILERLGCINNAGRGSREEISTFTGLSSDVKTITYAFVKDLQSEKK